LKKAVAEQNQEWQYTKSGDKKDVWAGQSKQGEAPLPI
jgi:hypothetical protein